MKTTDYKEVQMEMNIINDMKRKMGYCNSIIMLKGVNINALNEEDLMVIEAKLNLYEQIYLTRKPGLPVMLQGKEINHWRELLDKRYEYVALIEKGKELHKALQLIRQITEREVTISYLKKENKKFNKMLEDIILL